MTRLPKKIETPELLLTIQEAANLLRVSVSTLRNWDACGVLSPLRTPGGQRRYTKAQLDQRLSRHESAADLHATALPSKPTQRPSKTREPVIL